MSPDRFAKYWRGLLLSGIGIAAVAWLAATGRLSWYVHPRYLWFTVSLSAIAAIALIAAVPVVRRARDQHEHAHGPAHNEPHTHGDPAAPAPRRTARRLIHTTGAALLVGGTAAALLIAPPTTLSAATAQQREVNAGGGGGTADMNAADEDRDARDWAMLLRQNGGAEAEGRTARFIGFVLAGPDSQADLFYASRFVVSCCAVDAQPLGVPVLAPGWAQDHPAGSWVEVEGAFVPNPDVTSDQPVVLRPYSVTAIAEPDDPYVY